MHTTRYSRPEVHQTIPPDDKASRGLNKSLKIQTMSVFNPDNVMNIQCNNIQTMIVFNPDNDMSDKPTDSRARHAKRTVSFCYSPRPVWQNGLVLLDAIMDKRSELILSTYCRRSPARERPLNFHKQVTMIIVYALPDTSVCVCFIDFPRNTYTSTSSPILARAPPDDGNGSTRYPSRYGDKHLQGSPLLNLNTEHL